LTGMNAREFFLEVEMGHLRPLYYLYGPENALIEEALDKIKEKALEPATRDFNLALFNAKEDAGEIILESLQVFPLCSPRRLVVIRQADFIWNKAPSSFISYFLNPNPLTCAIFIGEKVDLRTKFFQALEKKGAIIPFYPPYEKELIRWVRSQAEQSGHRISEEAVSVLLERVGPSLGELKLELQKLTLGQKEKGFIGEEDVLALTGDIRSESLFELPMAVGHLNLRETLRLLRKNLQQGDPPLLLLSLIVRQLRLIWRAQELTAEGRSKKEIETRLKVLPRSTVEFWKQVESFPLSSLNQLWPLTLQADQELKSSRLEKGLLLEKYLWNLHLLESRKIRKPRGK